MTQEEIEMLKQVIGTAYYMKGYLKAQQDIEEKYKKRQEILERQIESYKDKFVSDIISSACHYLDKLDSITSEMIINETFINEELCTRDN